MSLAVYILLQKRPTWQSCFLEHEAIICKWCKHYDGNYRIFLVLCSVKKYVFHLIADGTIFSNIMRCYRLVERDLELMSVKTSGKQKVNTSFALTRSSQCNHISNDAYNTYYWHMYFLAHLKRTSMQGCFLHKALSKLLKWFNSMKNCGCNGNRNIYF